MIKDNRKQNKLPTSIRNESNKLNEEIPKLENEIDKLKKELSLETIDYKKIMDLSNTSIFSNLFSIDAARLKNFSPQG